MQSSSSLHSQFAMRIATFLGKRCEFRRRPLRYKPTRVVSFFLSFSLYQKRSQVIQWGKGGSCNAPRMSENCSPHPLSLSLSLSFPLFLDVACLRARCTSARIARVSRVLRRTPLAHLRRQAQFHLRAEKRRETVRCRRSHVMFNDSDSSIRSNPFIAAFVDTVRLGTWYRVHKLISCSAGFQAANFIRDLVDARSPGFAVLGSSTNGSRSSEMTRMSLSRSLSLSLSLFLPLIGVYLAFS